MENPNGRLAQISKKVRTRPNKTFERLLSARRQRKHRTVSKTRAVQKGKFTSFVEKQISQQQMRVSILTKSEVVILNIYPKTGEKTHF